MMCSTEDDCQSHLASFAAEGCELCVVLPCYNEEASLRKVVAEWWNEIGNWCDNYCFLVIDDGSLDATPGILAELSTRYGSRLTVFRRQNQGHGQSCLQGYRLATKARIPFVFQLDSDGQCDPQYFYRLWRIRTDFDVIYAFRKHRDDGLRRVFASLILQFYILVFWHKFCIDANVPYRLMNTNKLSGFLSQIPQQFNLANIALSVLLRKDRSVTEGRVPIRFRERYGGEPTVRFGMFGAKGCELHRQLRLILK